MTNRPSRRTVIAAGAGLALAATAAGVAAAQQQPKDAFEIELKAPPEIEAHHRKLMDAVAGKLGVSREKLEQAFADAHKEVGLPGDFLIPAPAHTFGPIGAERIVIAAPAGPGKAFFVSAHTDHEVVAKLLGITVDQLRSEMADRSLAEVARAHGVEAKAVVDLLVAEAHARIDGSGLPAAEVERMKQDIARAIEKMVSHKPGEHGPFKGGPFGLRATRAFKIHRE